MKRVKCLCGSSRRIVLCRLPTLEEAWQCECGQYYLNPRMSGEELRDHYVSGTFSANREPVVLKAKAEIRAKILKPHLSGLGLDIGCAEGYFSGIVGAEGIDPVGNDIVGWFPEDMPDKTYDWISAFHVIEHCEDPMGFVESVNKHLNKDGTFIVEFPCMRRVCMREGAELWNAFGNRTHLFEFTEDTMTTLLSLGGFDVTFRFLFSEYPDDKNVMFVGEKKC